MRWLWLLLIALWALGVLIVWAWCVHAKRIDRRAGRPQEGDPERPRRPGDDAAD